MKIKVRRLLTFVMVAVCAFALAACGGTPEEPPPSVRPHEHPLTEQPAQEPTCTDDGNVRYWYCYTCNSYFADSEGKQETDYQSVTLFKKGHTYSEEWSSDETSHWHEATCGCEDERGSYGEHVWDAGTITKEPTCEEDGEGTFTCKTCKKTQTLILNSPADKHGEWTDNVCGKCGYDVGGSKGLKWEYSSGKNGNTAKLVGIGTCTDTEVVVPEYHNGYKVTSVGKDFDSDKMTVMVLPSSVDSLESKGAWQTYSGEHRFTVKRRNPALCEVYKLNPKFYYGSLSYLLDSGWNQFICEVHGDSGHAESCACPSVVNVYDSLDEESRVKVVGDYVFCQKAKDESWVLVCYNGSDTDLVLPESIDGQPYSIRRYAFDMTGVTSVTLSDNVTSMEEWAFMNCYDLQSIHFGNGLSGGMGGSYNSTGFLGLKKLTEITAGENSERYTVKDNCLIEKETGTLVMGCSTSVIPSDGSVTKIGDSAFRYTSIEHVVIPSSVTVIGQYAFDGCVDLKTLVIPTTCMENIGYFSIHIGAIKDDVCSGAIFMEAPTEPEQWNKSAPGKAPVYWASEWEYVGGIPTPKA